MSCHQRGSRAWCLRTRVGERPVEAISQHHLVWCCDPPEVIGPRVGQTITGLIGGLPNRAHGPADLGAVRLGERGATGAASVEMKPAQRMRAKASHPACERPTRAIGGVSAVAGRHCVGDDSDAGCTDEVVDEFLGDRFGQRWGLVRPDDRGQFVGCRPRGRPPDVRPWLAGWRRSRASMSRSGSIPAAFVADTRNTGASGSPSSSSRRESRSEPQFAWCRRSPSPASPSPVSSRSALFNTMAVTAPWP